MNLDFDKGLQHVENNNSWSFVNNFLHELYKNISNKKEDHDMTEEKFSREGETYIVDEIGDDERYVFLTRESDGEVKQVFNISEELYQSLLRNHDDILRVKYENGRYEIIPTI